MKRRQFLAGSAAILASGPLAACMSSKPDTTPSPVTWDVLTMQMVPSSHPCIDRDKLPYHVTLGCWLMRGPFERIKQFLAEYAGQNARFEQFLENNPGRTAWIDGYFRNRVPGSCWAWMTIWPNEEPFSTTEGKAFRAAPMLAAALQVDANVNFRYPNGMY